MPWRSAAWRVTAVLFCEVARVWPLDARGLASRRQQIGPEDPLPLPQDAAVARGSCARFAASIPGKEAAPLRGR